MNVLTRSEYSKIVEYIVAEERERLTESINAVFERVGQNRDALIHAAVQALQSQPATTARVVTEILDQLGLLPAASEAPDETSQQK